MNKKLIFLFSLLICLFAAGCGSGLVVNSTGDQPDTNTQDGVCKTINNDCTLRAAIMEANSQIGVNKITFDLGSSSIYPDSLLPPLETDHTHIDGDGKITIDCGNISSPDYGLQIYHSNYNIIQGMRIRHCFVGIHIHGAGWGPGTGDSRNNTIGLITNEIGDYSQANVLILNSYGISIDGIHTFDNKVSGNFIGMHQDGTTLKPNEYSGIVIRAGAHDNLIGSLNGNTVLEGGNLISGNSQNGVLIHQESHDNQLSGNMIGTNLAGIAPRPNDIGVKIIGNSIDNILGISPAGEGQGNLVSGNNIGIKIENSNGTTIAGNFIGTDLNGTNPLPNNGNGIDLYSSSYTIIGTNGDGVSDPLEGNLISGNYQYGIRIKSSASQNTIIRGNKIGTDHSGSNPLGNGNTGLQIDGHYTQIGTNGDGVSDDVEGNLISANSYNGISLFSNGNMIAGNIIGLDGTGINQLGNQGNGIYVHVDSGQNLIGTDGDGMSDLLERNLISANCSTIDYCAGIKADGSYSVIAGNYIGTDITGTVSLSPNQYGIVTNNASTGNFYGTNGDGFGDDLEGNLISGNGGAAIIISGDDNTAAGNMIGTDISGTSAVANGFAESDLIGVVSIAGSNNILGTNGDGISDLDESNLISGNSGSGVSTSGQNHVIAGNKIGTDISGTGSLGNTRHGIVIPSEDPADNYPILIGTNGDGQNDQLERNIISANGEFGISVNASGVTIAGNSIGTDPSGAINLGNGQIGIFLLDGTTNHIIGGSPPKANTIAFNQMNGIRYLSFTSGSALITYNSIYSNQDLGIALNGSIYAQPNDPGDIDTGANDLMNYPVLTNASSVTGFIAINGDMINGLPNTGFEIQFFSNDSCDPSGYGEGKTYIGSSQIQTDGNGNAPFSVVLGGVVPPGNFVTATATADNKTSEFSACVEVTGGETTYSGEGDPCDLFDQESLELVTFDVRPESNLFYQYLKNKTPFPGSGPEDDDWVYYANLGDISASECGFEGPNDRLYCYFSIPERYFNTVQTLKIFSNICIPPFYVNEISILTKEPEGAEPQATPEGCHSGLSQRDCIAQGGTFSEGVCICPRR